MRIHQEGGLGFRLLTKTMGVCESYPAFGCSKKSTVKPVIRIDMHKHRKNRYAYILIYVEIARIYNSPLTGSRSHKC